MTTLSKQLYITATKNFLTVTAQGSTTKCCETRAI